jgi:ABC-type Fe3+ transport system substrate-binding protein
MKSQTVMILAVCILGVTFLFGVESRAESRLVIISPHWEGIRREFSRAFSDWFRKNTGEGVEIEWLEVGASSNMLIYLRSEFSRHPEGIGVDIIWGGGSIYYRALTEEGMLEPVEVDPDILAAIPKQVAGTLILEPRHHWFGTALSGFGILYNREVLRILKIPEPSSWRDLADPLYHDWLVLADPRHSGTSHALFEIMLQAYGWDQGFSVLTLCFANARTITKASSQIPVLVSTGEAALGPAIDFYAWSKMAEIGEGRLGFVLPLGESVINTDPIAVLKGSPHPETARAFIEFVLSEKGQKLWMLPAGDTEGPREFTLSRLSVSPDLYPELSSRAVVKFNPFRKEAGLDFDDDLAAKRWQVLNDLIGVGMIDAHAELSRAFFGIKDQDRTSPAYRRLLAPPENEAVFSTRNSHWSDPAFRNKVISSWAEFFRIKYQGVYRMSEGSGGNQISYQFLRYHLTRGLRYVFPLLILGLIFEILFRAMVRQARRMKSGMPEGSSGSEGHELEVNSS